MNCSDMETLLLLQDSGEISDAQRLELAQHLNGCAACLELRADLASLRKTLRTKSLYQPGPSQEVLKSIRDAAELQITRKRWMSARPWRMAVAAAACLAICLTTTRFLFVSPKVALEPLPRNSLATELIPLVAIIMGTETEPLLATSEDSSLTILANELLRLQGMTVELPDEKGDDLIQPGDYPPTTLLWNNTPESQFGRCG